MIELSVIPYHRSCVKCVNDTFRLLTNPTKLFFPIMFPQNSFFVMDHVKHLLFLVLCWIGVVSWCILTCEVWASFFVTYQKICCVTSNSVQANLPDLSSELSYWLLFQWCTILVVNMRCCFFIFSMGNTNANYSWRTWIRNGRGSYWMSRYFFPYLSTFPPFHLVVWLLKLTSSSCSYSPSHHWSIVSGWISCWQKSGPTILMPSFQ